MRAYYRNGTTVRPLADGDTRTVTALFERLGERSRRHRFAGPKPRLSQRELEALARADGDHHALVAYVEDDPEPAGMAWLVRDRRTADVAVAVVDAHQGRGIGSLLTEMLAADARAAGITTLTATVGADNPAATALLARVPARRSGTWSGSQLEVVLELRESDAEPQT